MKSAENKHSGRLNSKGVFRLHNVIFPIWLLVWIPSWLWLFLIPANLLVDGLVLDRRSASGQKQSLESMPCRIRGGFRGIGPAVYRPGPGKGKHRPGDGLESVR